MAFSFRFEVLVNAKRRKWAYSQESANAFTCWFESRGHQVKIRERFEALVFEVLVNAKRRKWAYSQESANAFACWFESRGHQVEIRKHRHRESKTHVGSVEDRSTLRWSIYQERESDLAPRFFSPRKGRTRSFKTVS